MVPRSRELAARIDPHVKQFKMANDQRSRAACMDMHGQMSVRCIIAALHNLPQPSEPKMARTWL